MKTTSAKLMLLICVASISSIMGCSSPFLIVQDHNIDFIEGLPNQSNVDMSGIWTSDKSEHPEGNLIVYKESKRHFFVTLQKNELSGVYDIKSFAKNKHETQSNDIKIARVGNANFALIQYSTKDVKDLPVAAKELPTAIAIARLSNINAETIEIYLPDADALEEIFPIKKPIYWELISWISSLFDIKNRYTVQYIWKPSYSDSYNKGPALNKRLMFILLEGADVFLEISNNNIFTIKHDQFVRLSTIEQAEKSAAANAARLKAEQAEIERLAEVERLYNLDALKTEEYNLIVSNYPSRIQSALQCASQFGRVTNVAISTIVKGDEGEWVISGSYAMNNSRSSFVAKAYSNPLKLKSIYWTELYAGSGYVSTSCF